MRIIQILAGLYALVSACTALVIIDSSLASACSYYMKDFEWGCGGFGTGKALYSCRCGNVDWLGSISNCIETQAKDENVAKHAIRHMITRCHQKGGYDYTYDGFIKYYHNASDYLHYPTEEDRVKNVTYPLSVNQTAFEVYMKSFDEMNHHVYKTQWLGWGLVFYWVMVIVIASLINISRSFNFEVKTPNWVKKYITFPALFKRYHEDVYFLAEIFPIRIPNRFQSLIVFAFVIQTVLSTALSYTVTQPNMYIQDSYLMTLDLIGYRCALIAFSLLPVVYFFGIRNNPFTWITGFTHAEFIIFHKCTAIVMALEALCHASIWTAYAIRDGGYLMWYMDAYWRWGVAGLVVVFICIFGANSLLRDHLYELFLLLHQVMSILFIVCMYYHCNTLGWLGWVYSMVGIFCFDKAMRIFKIVKSGGFQKSEIKKMEDGIIKMKIKKPKFFTYYPGCYAYIYFMNPKYGLWQSHPFTLVKSPVETDDHLIVYFRARGGVTLKVLKLLEKMPDKGETIETTIILEGPYGHPTHVRKSNESNLVAIGGGIGITSLLPSLYEWVQNQETCNNTISDSSTDDSKVSDHEHTTEIKLLPRAKLYWAIRNPSYIEWLHADLHYLASHNVSVKVIITDGSNDLEKVMLERDHLYETKYVRGRIDLNHLVKKNIESSVAEGINLQLKACGPAGFNDEMRKSVVENIQKDTRIDIDLDIESFSW